METINRYQGNTGRVAHIDDAPVQAAFVSPLPPATPVLPEESRPAPPASPGRQTPPGPLHDLRSGLDGLLSRLGPERLETEDFLVLAILFLLYRESRDKELLIAMGAYLFL